MQRRDWAGTALIAALTTCAALVKPALASVLLLSVAATSLVVVIVDVRRTRRQRPPHKRFASEGSSGDLEVTLLEEDFRPFQWEALILAAKVSIENRTSKPKWVTAFQWQIASPWEGASHKIEVLRERLRLEKERPKPPTAIGPRETVVGWVLIEFAHRAEGGEPGYELAVTDEFGHLYGVRRPSRIR